MYNVLSLDLHWVFRNLIPDQIQVQLELVDANLVSDDGFILSVNSVLNYLCYLVNALPWPLYVI